MTVLGNKMAADLPEIQGRGIWSVGSQDLIVQTPKLDNEEVATEVTELIKKFNGNAKPLFQKMLIEKPIVKTNEAEKETAIAILDGINAEEGAF